MKPSFSARMRAAATGEEDQIEVVLEGFEHDVHCDHSHFFGLEHVVYGLPEVFLKALLHGRECNSTSTLARPL